MSEKKKEKPKKDKPVFHKKSDAGKGDVPRVGISALRMVRWGEMGEDFQTESLFK